MYTRELGRCDCLVTRGNGKKSYSKTALLTPLNLVKAQISTKPNKELGRIVELEPLYINHNDDIARQCVRMYMAEALFRTVRQPLPEEDLFNFIKNTIITLDKYQVSANIHLYFMISLTKYLGFEPNKTSDETLFDLEEGVFTAFPPAHGHYINKELTNILKCFLDIEAENCAKITLNRTDRLRMLDAVELYYKLHISDFHGIKSTETLKQLFQ